MNANIVLYKKFILTHSVSTCFPANTEAVLNNRLYAVFRTRFYKTTTKNAVYLTQSFLYKGLNCIFILTTTAIITTTSVFSRTTQVSWHQKGKPFCILMKQEMMGVAVASARPYANHLHLTPDITIPVPHHSVFTGWMPFLLPNQQRQSTEGTTAITINPLVVNLMTT